MSKRILIIEDQEDNRAILRDLLGQAGYELTEAADGGEGVKLAERERPDLILMDIQLPVIDGYVTKPFSPRDLLAKVRAYLPAED